MCVLGRGEVIHVSTGMFAQSHFILLMPGANPNRSALQAIADMGALVMRLNPIEQGDPDFAFRPYMYGDLASLAYEYIIGFPVNSSVNLVTHGDFIYVEGHHMETGKYMLAEFQWSSGPFPRDISHEEAVCRYAQRN